LKPRTIALAASSILTLAAPLLAHAQSVTYAIDPMHTFVTYEIDHMGTSINRGRFDKKQGSVTIDRTAKTGKLELSFDLSAISTGVPPLDGHLKSKDFFNLAEFPTATFSADKFSFIGDKVSEVSGTLTLLGKSHPVTLVAKRFNCYTNPMNKADVCGGDFETTIQRSQWGMGWGLKFGVSDQVKLIVQVEAIKQP